MSGVFAMFFVTGIVCSVLYMLEFTQGRASRYTPWRELTINQWIFWIGALLAPIGFFGMLFFKG